MTTLIDLPPPPATVAATIPRVMNIKVNKGNSGCLFPFLKLTAIMRPDWTQVLIKDVMNTKGYLVHGQIPLLFIIASCTRGRVAEIGVWHGRTTTVLCLGSLPREIDIHCVDTFLGTAADHGHLTQGASFRAAFEDSMNQRGMLDRVYIHEGESTAVAATFPDDHFDMVFIDGAHDYESVTADVKAWRPKLKTGGLMLGHDYSEPTMPNRDFLELVVAADRHVKDDRARFRDFGWYCGIWGAIKI